VCLVGWWVAEGIVFEIGSGGDDGGPAPEDAVVGGDHGGGEAEFAKVFRRVGGEADVEGVLLGGDECVPVGADGVGGEIG